MPVRTHLSPYDRTVRSTGEKNPVVNLHVVKIPPHPDDVPEPTANTGVNGTFTASILSFTAAIGSMAFPSSSSSTAASTDKGADRERERETGIETEIVALTVRLQ